MCVCVCRWLAEDLLCVLTRLEFKYAYNEKKESLINVYDEIRPEKKE